MKHAITQLIGIVLKFLFLITVTAQAYTSRQASVFRNATSVGCCYKDKDRQRAALVQRYLPEAKCDVVVSWVAVQ